MISSQSTQRGYGIHTNEMIGIACHRLQNHRNQGMNVPMEGGWVRGGVTMVLLCVVLVTGGVGDKVTIFDIDK